MLHIILNWLYHYTGSGGSGPWYGWWSGFGSDIGEITVPAAVLGMYYKHNCHQPGCWRIGKHTVSGTPWCSKHHGDARARVAEDFTSSQLALAGIRNILLKLEAHMPDGTGNEPH